MEESTASTGNHLGIPKANETNPNLLSPEIVGQRRGESDIRVCVCVRGICILNFCSRKSSAEYIARSGHVHQLDSKHIDGRSRRGRRKRRRTRRRSALEISQRKDSVRILFRIGYKRHFDLHHTTPHNTPHHTTTHHITSHHIKCHLLLRNHLHGRPLLGAFMPPCNGIESTRHILRVPTDA